MRSLNSIKEVNLVTKRSLFTAGSGLFDDANNIFGLGSPNQMSVDVKFNNVRKTRSFEQKFKFLNDKRYSGELDKLVCVGYSDNHLETIFNTDKLISKIEFTPNVDRYNMYAPDITKRMILERLSLNV